MNRKRTFWKILLISSLFAFISVLASTAYAQAILWIEYDDFETVWKPKKLWQLGTSNMCSDANPYFDSGKMIQEAMASWYNPDCSPWPAPRVRSSAIPEAIPYITGIGARVTLADYTNYGNNNIIGRLGMIFYNDGVLENSGGDDRRSEVFAAIEIRPAMVLWYVVRLTDPNGIGAVFLKFEPLFLPTELSQVDLSLIPFDLRLWFDGTKVHLSAETEGPAGEIIKKVSTYTPAGQILPPKSTPLGVLESIITIPYLSPANPEPNLNDESYIMNEWDDVWVAVEASNWRNVRALEKIINKASKGK